MKKLTTKNHHLKTSSAFTLVELLVVIAVISILALIVTNSFIGAKAKSRDAQRKADLSMTATALENYRTRNGVYPSNRFSLDTYQPFSSSLVSLTSLAAATSRYMERLPVDPGGSSGSQYMYRSDGTQFKIVATAPESLVNCDAAAAQKIAGDYYDPANFKQFQISSSADELNR